MPGPFVPSAESSRRAFLAGAGAGWFALSTLGRPTLAQDEPPKNEPLKVAAVVTEFRFRSHAHVILENFLAPYLFNGHRVDPNVKVVSLYLDQTPAEDMGHDVAKQYGIPIFPSIGQALRVGGPTLGVDAVLSIGEHGNYPVNAKGQRQYPRKRFFDEIVQVFRDSDRVVPLYNDKHLSYRWDWAREMYDTARQMKIPFMAGSSVPLAQRKPPLEIPDGSKIVEAVSVHGGPLESYDFHGLEVLQSMVEARQGGATGVSEVQFLEGDALWQAADSGLWSVPLAQAAMSAELGEPVTSLKELLQKPSFQGQPPHGILVTYKDGLRAIVLRLGSSGIRWNFACRVSGSDKPLATHFYVGPWENRNLFKALSHAIQWHFVHGKAPYPVERTLLTTGILEAAMDSRVDSGKPVQTPHLGFGYEPEDYRPFREMGATWDIVTEDTPEPKGIDPTGSQQPR